MDSGLSEAQRARYAADGYLAPLDALTAEEAAQCHRQLAVVLRPDGTADVRVRNKPHLLFTWAADLVRHPRVLDAVAALLGPDLLVRQAVLFVKPPGDPGYVTWHQDAAYWDTSDAPSLSAWIALTDSVASSGAVRVMPGSHHGGRLTHDLAADARARLLRGQSVAAEAVARPEDTDCLRLRAGQFSLHHPWLLHGSPANRTDLPRIGLAVRYIHPAVRQTGPRQGALLVRGVDRYRHFDHETAPRYDGDAQAAAWHVRHLRRYAAQVAWQIVRRPTMEHLRLLGRLALRSELTRALVRRNAS